MTAMPNSASAEGSSSAGTSTLRLGTRASALARAQAGTVAASIAGFHVALVDITTTGDQSSQPITAIGTTGVFVSALREALLRKEIDLAVHSYKDLPTAPADGLMLAAVPTRADPRDALVGARHLDELPAGARVGTGAPRRVAQLRAHRADLDVVPVRGNVDTRVGLVAAGRIDAVVVAAAGLARLGREDVGTPIDPELMLPAPAQGALAVECRADDDLAEILAALDDPPTRATVAAERALLATLQAGCSAPIGAYATVAGANLDLRGMAAAVDGSMVVRRRATGPVNDAERTGERLAEELLAAGVSELLESTP